MNNVLNLSFRQINEILNGSDSSLAQRLEVLQALREIGGEALIIYCKEVLPKIAQEHNKLPEPKGTRVSH